MEETVQQLFTQQLAEWDLLRTNCHALSTLRRRTVSVGHYHPISLLFNPSRSISSFANVTAQAIAQRPCFLCADNRPAVQRHIRIGAEQNLHNAYSLLCNPYPILPGHLTIAEERHTPQSFLTRAHDMVSLATLLPHKVILFNGPSAGASAPDHLHFQAVDQGHLPLQIATQHLAPHLTSATPQRQHSLLGQPYLLRSTSPTALVEAVERLFAHLTTLHPHTPLSYNCFAWTTERELHFALYHRRAHRPACFERTDELRRAISPGAIDVAGIIVCALAQDFEQLSAEEIDQIFHEICY